MVMNGDHLLLCVPRASNIQLSYALCHPIKMVAIRLFLEHAFTWGLAVGVSKMMHGDCHSAGFLSIMVS
jgi:hypothetical protein